MTDQVAQEAAQVTLESEATTYADENKGGALKVLFPEPEEVRARIPLITRLTGRPVEIRKLIRANVEYELRRALEEDREPNWDKIDPIQRMLDLSVSLGTGKGRAEAVAIAKTEAAAQPSRGFFASLFGGRRRKE
jgi:hypothetical protein